MNAPYFPNFFIEKVASSSVMLILLRRGGSDHPDSRCPPPLGEDSTQDPRPVAKQARGDMCCAQHSAYLLAHRTPNGTDS